MKIIDVPGFCGKSNIKNDAQICSTLKKFLDTDPELKKCIPHVVIITARFDDQQLTDPLSPFVQTLKAVDLLNRRLLDRSSCNVLILLTHFMTGKKAYRENPQLRYDEVIDLVQNYTSFPQMPYILVGENDPENWDLPRFNNKHSYCLPNVDDTYPTNLIEVILKISAGGTKSSLGPEFFKKVFQARQNIFLWRSVLLPLVDRNGSRCRKILPILKAKYKDGNNEVSHSRHQNISHSHRPSRKSHSKSKQMVTIQAYV